MKTKEPSVSNLKLYIDTANEDSRIILFLNDKILSQKEWSGRTELSDKLIFEIDKLLKDNNFSLSQLSEVVAFAGPGSYTGLRIGLTIANFLAWSLKIPIVSGEVINNQIKKLKVGENNVILPIYYQPAKITKSKK